jgi:HPt (histidine-containing phosphotransfer) domain-containing protein
MDSGMDDVLAKPVSFDDLMKLLACSRQDVGVDALPPVSPGPANEIGGEAGCLPAVPPVMQELFSERILADFGASQERLTTYFNLLRSDIGAQIEAMKAALEAGDHAGLRMAAHAAKGVARGLRDQELSLLAGQIENQARNDSLAGVEGALSEFSRLFRSIYCI